jgi:DNA-binding XRE family transcriptional regulator
MVFLVRTMFPAGNISLTFDDLKHGIPAREHGANMNNDESTVGRRALETAAAFGSMIRTRRKAMNMRQDELALATGVGRRFLIELEAGKPSCQLGRSLLVAEALGLSAIDVKACEAAPRPGSGADLPDLPDEMEDPDGRSAREL